MSSNKEVSVMSSNDATKILKPESKEFKQSRLYKEISKGYLMSKLRVSIDPKLIQEIMDHADQALDEMGLSDPIHMMLVTQMLTVHSLQQDMVALANNSSHDHGRQSYVNSVTKLSNLFATQVSLLQKLKNGDQLGNVKAVHVHEGAQAVVGTVNCYGGRDEENRK